MSSHSRGVRAGDVVLAALLTALGAFLMVENVLSDPAGATRVDSRSWALVPVFALATLPVLWWRRGVLGVLLVSSAAMAVHVLAFGWLVRCGAGLPLALALAFLLGRQASGRRAALGLLLGVVLQALVLVRDSAAGFGVLPFTVVLAALAWGAGRWVQRRATRPAALPASREVGAGV